MNDFFSKRPADAGDDTTQQDTPQVTEPEKIKVGEVEYDPQELDKLVNLGKLGQEMQTKYNTDFQKVWPEYTRSRQELKEAKEAREELEKFKKEQEEAKNEGQEMDPSAVAQAQQAARKLKILMDDDVDAKIVPKFRTWYQQERATERLLDGCKGLEKTLDGKDGRPAFRTEEILQYMSDTGIKDPELAYKAKYEPQIDQWKADQFSKGKRPGMATITDGATTKTPKPVKVTRDNVDELMSQALEGQI